jgi:hypothetical protein
VTVSGADFPELAFAKLRTDTISFLRINRWKMASVHDLATSKRVGAVRCI